MAYYKSKPQEHKYQFKNIGKAAKDNKKQKKNNIKSQNR